MSVVHPVGGPTSDVFVLKQAVLVLLVILIWSELDIRFVDTHHMGQERKRAKGGKLEAFSNIIPTMMRTCFGVFSIKTARSSIS